jgi:hypothetical protein
LADQAEMRQGLRTVAQHRKWLETWWPGEQTIAVVGNGNLFANPYFVAYCEDHLYHLADEPVFQRK